MFQQYDIIIFFTDANVDYILHPNLNEMPITIHPQVKYLTH